MNASTSVGQGTEWSSCELAEHVEEVRQRGVELERLTPWLIADPLLLDALDLYRAAVRELIEHHDGLHDDDVLVRVIES